MIHKSALKGKYVEFIDRNGAFRICKVAIITGNTLTVVDVLKHRERVESDKVLYWIHHGHVKEPIDWSIRRERKPKTEEAKAAIDPPQGVTVVTLKKPEDVETLQITLEEAFGE